MNPQDLFAAGVRLFGVWMLVRMVEYLSAAFTLTFVYGTSDPTNTPRGMMTFAAFYIGLATLFLLGTRLLTGWTYGEDRPVKATSPVERERLD
jgi:hypothetical protein